MLLPFGKKSDAKVYTTKAEIPGKYRFDLDKLYGGSMSVLIQEIGKKKKQDSKYMFSVSERASPPIYGEIKTTRIFADSISNDIIEENLRRKEAEDEYLLSTQGTISLDEVVLESSVDIPKRDEVVEKYGKPDYVIKGEEIKEKTKDWTPGLLRLLMGSFGDKVTVSRRGGRLRIRAAAAGRGEPTFIVVDGIPIRPPDYAFVENINPREVVHLEVIERINRKSIISIFEETFGTIPQSFNIDAHVVAIYTKSGKGIHGALTNKESWESQEIPVFAVSKEYYSPKYKHPLQPIDWDQHDLRTLMYWNPNINLDKKGSLEVDFFNSDISGRVVVVVEFISDDGKIGYQELEYSLVKGKPSE